MAIRRSQHGDIGIGGYQSIEELARILAGYMDNIFSSVDWVMEHFEPKGLVAAHIATDDAHPQYRRLDTLVPIVDLEGPFEEEGSPGPYPLFIKEDKTWSIVTKEDVGLDKVLNEEQATKEEFDSFLINFSHHVSDFEELEDDYFSFLDYFDDHENIFNQFVSWTEDETSRIDSNLTNHISNSNNPHQVTKNQVGLGNVDNIQQATKTEYNAHVSDTVRHTTQADKDKLAGIEVGATRNSTDAQLRDRGTHTGTQPASSITGLGTAATSDIVQVTGQSESLIMSQKAVTDILYTGTIFSRGMIILWSGSLIEVPDGWAICDGTNGTPNLADRFVIGAGGNLSPGNTGGSSSVVSSSAGAHTHPITVNATTLLEAQTPRSALSFSYGTVYVREEPLGKGSTVSSLTRTGDTKSIRSASAATGHTHGASSASSGAHSHTVNTMPPYYSLAYIMKL